MDSEIDRKMTVLLIFLEHPGGLRYAELWRIVEDQKICAKGTLNKLLKELMEQDLIVKSKLGRYTLGFTESIAQMIQKSSYVVPEQVERFLDTLYKGYEQSGEKQAELFGQLSASYLEMKLRQMNFMIWLLFPFLFDNKVRKIWFQGYEYALDILFDKFDEISQKFFGMKISYALQTKYVQEKFWTPQLELLTRSTKLANKKIADLINQLDIKDDAKRELKSQIASEPRAVFGLNSLA